MQKQPRGSVRKWENEHKVAHPHSMEVTNGMRCTVTKFVPVSRTNLTFPNPIGIAIKGKGNEAKKGSPQKFIHNHHNKIRSEI